MLRWTGSLQVQRLTLGTGAPTSSAQHGLVELLHVDQATAETSGKIHELLALGHGAIRGHHLGHDSRRKKTGLAS